MSSDYEKAKCKQKKRFKTNADALFALNKINPSRKAKMPNRVYKCSVCSGWHLTSSTKL